MIHRVLECNRIDMKSRGNRSPPSHPASTHRSFASISKRVPPRPSISLRHQSPSRSYDPPFLPKLRNSVLFRPSIKVSSEKGVVSVYVLEDGGKIPSNCIGLRGFPYIITETGSIFQLLRASRERLNPEKRYSYVFSFDGIELLSLEEVGEGGKVLLVSETQEFAGVAWERQEEGRDLSENWLYDRLKEGDSTGDYRKRVSRFPRGNSIRIAPRPSLSPTRDSKLSRVVLNPVAKVDELLKPLSPDQMQSLAERYSLSRGRIHALYARYKTLLALHVCSNPGCGRR